MTTLAGRLGQSRVPWMLVGVLAATLAGALGGLLGPLPFVAVAGAVALVAAMVRAPGLVLGAYLLIPYYKGAVQPYSPVDLTLLLAAVNAAQFIPVVFAKRRPTGFGLQLTLWLALGAVVLGGVLYAPDPSMAFAKAVSYWVLVVLPLVPASLRVAAEPRQLALVAIAFFVMGVVTSVLGLSLLSPDSRLAILGMNTIQVARAALFLPIVGVLYIIPLRRQWLTVLTVALIPASLVVAVASGSRGPLLVLALIGGYRAVRALAAMRVGRWRLIGAGAGVVLLATVALVFLGPSLPVASLSRFGDLLAYVQGSGAGVETSAAVRVVLFGLAVQLWAS
ncbi:MAG TPA: hypothetical protein VIH37_03305, partial [Candidatus Limnocylindrales bacterium]